MPSQTDGFPQQPPPGERQSFLHFIIRNSDFLRELLEQWTVVLADPETPTAQVETINHQVDLIAWGLTDVLETVRMRMRALEEEGYGRGGTARARESREGEQGGRD